jgi:hypothetical protein
VILEKYLQVRVQLPRSCRHERFSLICFRSMPFCLIQAFTLPGSCLPPLQDNELFVGRAAMLGWAFGLLGEVTTGRGFLSQLGYEVRAGCTCLHGEHASANSCMVSQAVLPLPLVPQYVDSLASDFNNKLALTPCVPSSLLAPGF